MNLFNTGQPGGLLITLAIGFGAILAGTLIGGILGVLRSSERRWLWVPTLIYIQAFRNVPLLILIFWAFLVPPVYGLTL